MFLFIFFETPVLESKGSISVNGKSENQKMLSLLVLETTLFKIKQNIGKTAL